MKKTSKYLAGGTLVLLVSGWMPKTVGSIMLFFGSLGITILILQHAASRYDNADSNNKKLAGAINARLIYLTIGMLVLLFWTVRLTMDEDSIGVATGLIYMYSYFPCIIVLIGSAVMYSLRAAVIGWDLKIMLYATVTYMVLFTILFIIFYDKWIIFTIAVIYASCCIFLSAIWLYQHETVRRV